MIEIESISLCRTLTCVAAETDKSNTLSSFSMWQLYHEPQLHTRACLSLTTNLYRIPRNPPPIEAAETRFSELVTGSMSYLCF